MFIIIFKSASCQYRLISLILGPPKDATRMSTLGLWTSLTDMDRDKYSDAVGSRALSSAFYGDGVAMTGGACIAYCTQLGYNYAGTEYASECFCGNELRSQSTLAAPGDCNMACTGDATTQCGGPNRLTVFWNGQAPPSLPSEISQKKEWSSLGCYTDHGIANRTLTTIMPTTGGQSALTVELCISACQDAGFTLAGLEYGSECFCGKSIANGGAPAPDGSAGCNMGCNGNKTEKCGGPDRLNLYGHNNTRANGWGYQGCYIDGVQGRILTKQQPDSSSMTIESCISTCEGLGYAGAGLEYSFQCFCDDYLYNGAALTSDSDCNMPCSGNPDQKCGAGGRMSVYANSTLPVFRTPAVQKTNLPGNWTYQGCLYDLDVPRSLKYQLILDKNNTAENCLSQCSKFGYGAGGMEYGRECWCGDEATVKALNRQLFPDSDCNMPCTGNKTTICGAGNRISYYTWAGTPLNSWDFPTGGAAGEYKFLIGGVVIPLITTLAINGKVTFVEKFGTGAANTTGAYELDLAQISNFTGAWRPMHLKSDVFCAAGLTLPDKAGRQINVGGWANDDTFGVRLYTPDGSPGVWGVNDWEEDKSTVRLQAGRWYPTSMIMANGSILVVGGQVGANGAPVPSLEILPKPAGGFVQYCDWLDRTDPNNLYPYLAVLPSGGVFVAYYNEARVLDPVSLNTVKTIENIPAAVNDFNGGRTYPFEGTAVLMPQYAPYADPLTIMICGGSTPGPEIALDNCVSVSPEEANPKWTIERMVSFCDHSILHLY
jgi:Glyoxal oxidase N-terminus/WSC domain